MSPDKVKLNIDMFHPCIMCRVLCKSDGALIITEECFEHVFWHPKILQKVLKPNKLFYCESHGHVFWFDCGLRNRCLFLCLPTNGSTSKEEDIAGYRFPIFPIAIICITVSLDQTCDLSIVGGASCLGSLEIADRSFSGLEMRIRQVWTELYVEFTDLIASSIPSITPSIRKGGLSML